MRLRAGRSGLTVRGNRVGLYGDGTQSTSPGTTITLLAGGPLTNATIANNVVAGGGLGIIVGPNIGGPTISGNRIGLTDAGEVPSGPAAGHAIYGLRLDGTANAVVSNTERDRYQRVPGGRGERYRPRHRRQRHRRQQLARRDADRPPEPVTLTGNFIGVLSGGRD